MQATITKAEIDEAIKETTSNTAVTRIFPEKNGKGHPKRTTQIPWVVVYATEQRYIRTWTAADAVEDYPTKPDSKEHFGPYVKLVTWDSVGMCVMNGLPITQTTDTAKLTPKKNEALKWMLAGEEDPAWAEAHQEIVNADADYKARLEKAQKSDQKRVDKKFKRQQAKQDAQVQRLMPDVEDMVPVDEYDQAVERQYALEQELEELKERKGDTATDDEIAARGQREKFWQDMRAHYYCQVQADKNAELGDTNQAPKKLIQLIPFAARQIFTKEELNNVDQA